MKQICVVGVGYVGLVTAACFSDLGNRVIALDINQERVENLKKGIMPIYEPGLEEVVERNVRGGRLTFTSNYDEALKDTEFAFIAVGTPSGVDGEADLRYVESAAIAIAQHMSGPLIIINKSTVPVGTGDWVADIISRSQPQPIPFSVVSCPEFLREGSAIPDFTNPHRTVLGSLDREAAEKVAQLHLPLRLPIVITDLRTAEMIKYASNAFLATKISFINEIANICEALGADVKEVAVGMGYDSRIGRAFLEAGLGYGGSCFPKDVKALAYMAAEKGRHPQLLRAVMDINDDRRRTAIFRLQELVGDFRGKTIGILGLSFKPNTDDMRDAPAITIANKLLASGAKVRGYDPVAMEVAGPMMPGVEMVHDPYVMAEGADALVVVTEWNEFKALDLEKIRNSMKTPIILDGRNIYDPASMAQLGFCYYGMGRGHGQQLRHSMSNSTPPVCNYDGSDYQASFWDEGDRAYEDGAEAVALKRLLPIEGTLLLEVGAGAGRNTTRYVGFDRIVVLDYSYSQLQQAQERLGDDQRYIYVAADVYRLPFISGLFGTATMIRTLHHMSDPRLALKQIHHVMRPDGVFILEYANKQNLKAILRYIFRRQAWNPFSPDAVEFAPLNFDFHPKAVRGWLESSGFAIERQLTVSHFRMSWLKRLLPTRLLIALDSLAQLTGNAWQLSPSVFVRSHTIGDTLTIPLGAFFRCPACGHWPLLEANGQLPCTNCGAQWQFKDGIYDFRQPVDA